MASVNRVTIVGYLGKDPEIRYSKDGVPIANISVATTSRWNDAQGQKKESTEWHRIVFYRNLAEIVGEYLKKGSSIYIEGRLRTRSWDDNGVARYSTEVIADNMQMLGGSQSQDNGRRSVNNEKQGRQPAQASNQHASNSRSNPQSSSAKERARGLDSYEDDDIPF